MTEELKNKNDWTIMVYLAGENNLAEEMVYSLKSMKLIGSEPGIYEVVALYDGGLGPVTVEIDKNTLNSLDVTDLHSEAEKTRHDQTAQQTYDLKALVEEAEEAKKATKQEAMAARLHANSDNAKNGATIRDESTKMYQGGTRSPQQDGPLQELLALIAPETSKAGKRGTRGAAAPAARATLTESAQAFLKEALEINDEVRAFRHEEANALHQEYQTELTA